MRTTLLTALLLLTACASAPGAADVSPSQTPAAANAPAVATYPASVDIPAGTYRLDPRHASVQFRIRHMSVGYFVARFDTKDATLTLDADDPTRSEFDATIDPM